MEYNNLKTQKSIRFKNQRRSNPKQTLEDFFTRKIDREKLQKQRFFQEVSEELKSFFDQQNLQLFEEYAQNIYMQSKIRKNRSRDNKKSKNQSLHSKKDIGHSAKTENNYFKVFNNIDPNVFNQQTQQGIFPNYLTFAVHDKQRYISTPKLNTRQNKKKMQRGSKMRQVEQNMRKNYGRLKQRVQGYNNLKTFDPYIFLRRSQVMTRNQPSRNVRYNTLLLQNSSKNQDYIPQMFLKDMNSAKRSVNNQKTIEEKDRRFLCFQKRTKRRFF